MKDQEEEIQGQFSPEQNKENQNCANIGTGLNDGDTIPYGQRIDKDDDTRLKSPGRFDEDETEVMNLDQSAGGA